MPVGENLQDHVLADGVEFFTDNSISVSTARAENLISSWAYTLYGGGKYQYTMHVKSTWAYVLYGGVIKIQLM